VGAPGLGLNTEKRRVGAGGWWPSVRHTWWLNFSETALRTHVDKLVKNLLSVLYLKESCGFRFLPHDSWTVECSIC